ncbi:MAG: hypothetical protein ACPLUI_13910, partial [Desulfofundulus sp.]
MSDIKKYVLDTSALLTYYQDEAGADLIEEVFVQATSAQHDPAQAAGLFCVPKPGFTKPCGCGTYLRRRQTGEK